MELIIGFLLGMFCAAFVPGIFNFVLAARQTFPPVVSHEPGKDILGHPTLHRGRLTLEDGSYFTKDSIYWFDQNGKRIVFESRLHMYLEEQLRLIRWENERK